MNAITTPPAPPERLGASDLEHLLLTLEKSLGVRTRTQFYLWAQGALQGFIVHESLWCAHGDVEQLRLQVEPFSRVRSNERIAQQVADPVDGLLTRLVDEWLRRGRRPLLLSSQGGEQMSRRQLITDLGRCGYEHVLAHGVREVPGDGGSFFVFAGIDHLPSARDAWLVELLMPHLHLALQRMRLHEAGSDSVAEVAPATVLTRREIQILYWVRQGKTNPDIGKILGITTPTVKNHLQKLMRKLNVANRAQAVAKSATLRLVARSDGRAATLVQ
jgi:transcriptional regulator EpsA